MQNSKSIEHLGVIQSIQDRIVKVSFLQESACASCHVNGVCSASDSKDQELDITDYSGAYSVGEQVNVILEESLGMRALFLGYVLPFIIVFVVLAIISSIFNNDLYAGLISLLCLVPYYIILYLKKDQLQKTFSFKLKKLK